MSNFNLFPGKNIDLSSLRSPNYVPPSQEAIDQANYLLQNPIDLNEVGLAAVFPICSVKLPPRTAMGLSYLEEFRRKGLPTVHLSFHEIEQVMTKFAEEVDSIKVNISHSCTGMNLFHECFSYDLSFYIDDLNSKKEFSYDINENTYYYMLLRRRSGDGLVFFKKEFRFYDLLLNSELSRRYIAGEYELPDTSEEDDIDPVDVNVDEFSFDKLQEDF